jgi:hypothetical protein
VLAFAGRAASFAPKGSHTVIGRLGGYYNLRISGIAIIGLQRTRSVRYVKEVAGRQKGLADPELSFRLR